MSLILVARMYILWQAIIYFVICLKYTDLFQDLAGTIRLYLFSYKIPGHPEY